MLTNPYQQYQQMQAQTASPGELVVMLYEGAIAFIGRACQHLERKEYEAAHRLLIRAQEIVVELQSTLNLRAGGPLAVQLDAIYTYLLDRLIAANVGKDPAPAQEVAKHLRELLPAWKAAAAASVASRQPLPAGTHAVLV